MTNLIRGEIIKNHKWTDRLFTLIINAPIKPFIAGQFTKLALKIDGKMIQKAYSYVNSPDSKKLEFYLVKIPNGILTSYLYKLQSGDSIFIKETASGFFTIKELPKCKTLWMLSTGTAIGPFLSILQCKKNLKKMEKIILVHAVRYEKDLTYLPLMKKLKKKYKGKLKIQTIISREKKTNSLHGRIPNLIDNGKLENSMNEKIDPTTTHVMICGNPKMIKDTKEILHKRNLTIHLRKKTGQITTEQYW